MNIGCSIHIKTILTIDKEQAEILLSGECNGLLFVHFKKPVSGKIEINYPLHIPTELDVKEETRLGGLLWEIAQKYKEIYADANTTNTFGVWGHDIGDLYIEAIAVTDTEIEIHVGS